MMKRKTVISIRATAASLVIISPWGKRMEEIPVPIEKVCSGLQSRT
jgi:hypothetical protein